MIYSQRYLLIQNKWFLKVSNGERDLRTSTKATDVTYLVLESSPRGGGSRENGKNAK